MAAGSGCTTSKLISSLWIFRIISRRCLRFISFQWPRVEGFVVFWIFSGGLAFILTSTLNSTWPGPVGETYSFSPAGSRRSPFQDNATTIYAIAHTGAMLQLGQKRSKEIPTLAAEPGFDRDSNC